MRAFVAVARAGRFTTAAASSGVSQPTLSRHVAHLEEELGAKLLVRTHGGVVLTDAGQRFLPHAERALLALEAGASEVGELTGDPRGDVQIGALPTVAAYVLPEVIASFHRAHPAVRLLVREGFTDKVEELVARGELDLGLVQYPVRHEELSARVLWREDHLVAVPRRHRLSGARSVRLVDLVDEPFVVIPGTRALRTVEAACAAQGKKLQIALETENLESVRKMVEAGLGVALVPRLMTSDRRWRAGLVPIAGTPVERQVAIIHRGGGYLSAAARTLREAIISRAAR